MPSDPAFNSQATGLPPTPDCFYRFTTPPAPPHSVSPPQPPLDPLLPTMQTFPPQPWITPAIVPSPATVCGCGFCQLVEVPQRRYQSTQISMEADSRIGETVTFSKGGCGILLRDAIDNRLSGLVGGDDLMFDGFNVSAFSLRIEVRPLIRFSL